MEVYYYIHFQWCEYSLGPWVSFVTTKVSVKVTKVISSLWSINSQLTFPIVNFFFDSIKWLLSKSCKPENFQSHNTVKLSFTNTLDLCFNFVGWESFLESDSSDILALYETNLNGLVDLLLSWLIWLSWFVIAQLHVSN